MNNNQLVITLPLKLSERIDRSDSSTAGKVSIMKSCIFPNVTMKMIETSFSLPVCQDIIDLYTVYYIYGIFHI